VKNVNCRNTKYTSDIQVRLPSVSHVWWCAGVYWVCVVVLLHRVA